MEQNDRYKPGFFMNYNWQMSFANDQFDPETYEKSESNRQLHQLRDHYRKYKSEPMDPYILEYWDAIGVAKDFYPCDLNTARSRRDAHHYSVLRPKELSDNKYPVVYFGHAGGQDAFDSEMYGLGEMIPKEQFILISPNQYGAEEFKRIIAEAKEQYPIDMGRIYVMGFSGGSASTLEIAMECPDQVAGVALFPGPNAFNQVKDTSIPKAFAENPNLRMPIICVGGSCDGSDRWPLVDEQAYGAFNMCMRNMCKIPDYEDVSLAEAQSLVDISESKVEQAFGLHFHKAFITDCDDTYMYIGDYMEEHGTSIVRLCSVLGLPHEIYPRFVGTAWVFLREFQRDEETGKLIYKFQDIDFRTRR